MTPELRVCLLAAPRAEIGRTSIETDTRKATALPAYLAVSQQPQTYLAGLLQPNFPRLQREPTALALSNAIALVEGIVSERPALPVAWVGR